MLGLTQETNRDPVCKGLQVLGFIAVTELGHDKAGSDTVDPDAVLGHLNGQCLGEHLQAALGSAVGKEFPFDPGDKTVDGGNIHNSAGDVVFFHISDRSLCAVCGGAEVQGDLLVPVVKRHILKFTGRNLQRTAGIVDQHVNGTEICQEFLHQTLAILTDLEVRAVDLRFYPMCQTLGLDLLGSLGIFTVGNAHIVAFFGQRNGCGSTDAMGGAGDQCVFRHFRCSFPNAGSPYTVP